ncbi:kelch-like protein 17 [Paramacrobiotus metropolitanus]|uniref:kelch-like protein 17 n=1 Tax=Paramacrobiotus metropolitanus TaxID=2943436 RepID=UPI002445B2C6|nr:kelch-like protein 17 [Paramacrobiotus metropolitanus]
MSKPGSSDHPPHRCLAEFLRGLREQQSTGTLCDVVLKGCEESAVGIPCHRNVLSVHSDYFRAVFTQDWKDSSQRIFPLHNIDSSTLNELVNYAYTLELNLNDDNVESILIAAQFLQMTAAARLCWDYVEKHVDLSNCLAVHALASNYHNPGLADTVLGFIYLYFLQVAKSHEFLQVDAQQLIAVLTSDSVDVVSEDEVWEAVLRWLDHDCPARLTHVPTLLPMVRVACLSEPCRQEYALILRSVPAGMPQSTVELVGGTTQIAKPRHSVGAQEVILCLGGTCEEPFVEEEARVDVFCPSIPAVWRLKDLPDLVECCSAVLLDPGCIMINSMNCIGTVQRNSRYTGLRDEWRAIEGILPEHREPLRESPLRQAGALASLNGRVYAAGGFDPFAYGGVKALASVDAYDPRSDSWSAVAALPIGLMGLAMVACKGRLYVFGGEDTEDVSNAVFAYDPAANTWTRLADMPTARSGCRGCVAPNGLIYVTGT